MANSFLAEIRYVAADDPDPTREGTVEEKKYRCAIFSTATTNRVDRYALWGDEVKVVGESGSCSRIWSRGGWGWIASDRLTDARLLELYFIDVGQGDGVLIRMPDGRHLMIDGGFHRKRQPTNKNAADFVDWKFYKDYGDHVVRLGAMIASHCDADHYGGMDDLINTSSKSKGELDCGRIDVGDFFHAGVSWWKPSPGEITAHDLTGDDRKRWLGPVSGRRLRRLLKGMNEARAAVATDADPSLQGDWKTFVKRATHTAQRFQRLGVNKFRVDEQNFVPGYEGGQAGEASIRVLGPVTQTSSGEQVLVDLESHSQNTNGHSLLLRIDYGSTRTLLTGDLNERSMRLLLDAYEGHESELACDVTKGCHHGSDDISYAFLDTLKPCASIISSGDAESHAHPRPVVIAASGLTGHKKIDADGHELITPLVYCTEIERSYALGQVQTLDVDDFPGGTPAWRLMARRRSDYSTSGDRDAAQDQEETKAKLAYKEAAPGRYNPKRGERSFRGAYALTGIVYGLVNVRTDGETIVCATMRESGEGWTIRHFRSRFA